MNIAIRKTDGIKISSDLYKSMQDHADLVVRRLLEGISSDPRVVGTKSLTKSVIKSLFYEEFRQAILDLEAEKRELRLCAGHWKAEVMLGQALLRRNGGSGSNAAKGVSNVGAFLPPLLIGPPKAAAPVNASRSSDGNASLPLQLRPPPTRPPKVTAPINTIKRTADTMELSPGLKSSRKSPAQKRKKDDPVFGGQKNSLPVVPSCEYCIPPNF